MYNKDVPIVVLGYIAGLFTMISFLPQVVKTWRTKKTKDISLPTYVILTAGILLWFLYGILIKDGAIILTNSVIFISTLTILILKIKNG